MTWRCSWQDYRGWPSMAGQAPPLMHTEDFDTEDAARSAANVYRKMGLTACVSRSPPPTPARQHKHNRDPFNAGWKLTS